MVSAQYSRLLAAQMLDAIARLHRDAFAYQPVSDPVAPGGVVPIAQAVAAD